MTAADFLFTVFGMISYTGCSVWFLYAVPREIESSRWIRWAAWGIYTALSILIPTLWLNDGITMPVMAASYLLIIWFLYHRSRTWLLYGVIFNMMIYAAQAIGIYLAAYLETEISMNLHTLTYAIAVLKAIFMTAVTLMLRMIVQKRQVSDRKDLKIRGMILIPSFSMILIFLYCISGNAFFEKYGYGWVIVFCILFLVINFYCLYVWYDLAENRELKHRLELIHQQNELKHQYYEDLEKNYNNSRKIIHDIRNHLNILEQSSKMKDGSEENTAYFQDVHGMLNSLGLKFYTDNKILNIVLNDKLKKLDQEQAECSLGGADLGFLADIDVTTIFANLLDNAIEAGEGREDFWLKIRRDRIQDFTVVKLWNPSSGGYQPGRSGKTGHEGLGLENVRHAVEKYQGELELEEKAGIFSVTMVFPGK